MPDATKESIDAKTLAELARLAQRGIEEARDFHFERSANVGVHPDRLLALVEAARDRDAAREEAKQLTAEVTRLKSCIDAQSATCAKQEARIAELEASLDQANQCNAMQARNAVQAERVLAQTKETRG
jgi:hypothetical protein